MYGNFIYREMDEEYIDFLNSLSVQENPEMRFISFDGFLGNKLSRTKSKSELLSSISAKDQVNMNTANEEKDRSIVSNMILLSNDIFLRNPDKFKVQIISDLIGCQRVYIDQTGDYSSDCLHNVQSSYMRKKTKKNGELSQNNNLGIKNKLKTFLSDPLNPRVLYRSNAEEIDQMKSEAFNSIMGAEKFSKMTSTTSAYRKESGAKLGLSSEINPIISPSLYIKQVTFISHFYRNFFLVLTKKTLLSVYDVESGAVFYLFKIQEEESYTELYVVGSEIFVLKIKKNSNNREYFKILIFKFCEESMTVTLVNSKTRLINFLEANVLFYENMVYLVTLKQSFFGLTIYRFHVSDDAVSYDALIKSREQPEAQEDLNNQLMTLHKNMISFKNHFTNILVIETYLKKIQRSKIKCRKNKFSFIECLIQFPALDNILVGLKLKTSLNSTKKRAKTQETQNLTKDQLEVLMNLKAPFAPATEIFESESDSTTENDIKYDFSKKSANEFIILNSLKLIRNKYRPEVVTKFTNYFYKKYLILVYEVHSFVRLYFYFLGSPESPDQQMHQQNCLGSCVDSNSEAFTEIINFCDKGSGESYISLYYRLEIEKNRARFLYLRFSYDLVADSSALHSENKEIANVVKVVFDSRIESYHFNSKIQIKMKKDTLDFDHISLYAKNHNTVVNGR